MTHVKPLIDYELLLPHLDVAYLDCIADNIGLLLLHAGQQNVRPIYAHQWYFAFAEDQPQSLPLLEKVPLADAVAAWSLYRVHQEKLDISRCLETFKTLLKNNQPVIVFGDAFFMPWLPYFNHEHQEHSFIIDGMNADERLLHIVDAYDNTTEWGKAQPIACELATSALQTILTLDSTHAKTLLFLEKVQHEPKINIKKVLLTNAQDMVAAHQQRSLHAFVQHYRTFMPDIPVAKRFTLALWLIARARAVHGLWLYDIATQYPALLPPGYAECYEQHVVVPWKQASEQAYIMQRRILRGRPAPEACFTMIETTVAEQELALAQTLLLHLQATV